MTPLNKRLSEIRSRVEKANAHPEAVGDDNSYMRGGEADQIPVTPWVKRAKQLLEERE